MVWTFNEIVSALKNAVEIDHEGGLIDLASSLWNWNIVKVHRREWKSRSGAHMVSFSFPPFLKSRSYTYYLIKPIAIVYPDRVITQEGAWYDDAGTNPMPECLSKIRIGNIGTICWYSSKGIRKAMICMYECDWNESAMDEAISNAVVRGVAKSIGGGNRRGQDILQP